MSQYKYVLFDWDGCLAQTLEAWLESYRETFEHFGVTLDDRTIGAQFGDWYAYRNFGITEEHHDLFLEMLGTKVQTRLPAVKLYAGADLLLRRLRDNGVKIAVVSTARRCDLDIALSNNALTDEFDAIVTAEDVTHHKPHAEPIETALQKLGGQKSSAVMIGDSSKDLGAATNAGIDSILMYPETHATYYEFSELVAHQPTHVCASFDEVAKLLLD